MDQRDMTHMDTMHVYLLVDVWRGRCELVYGKFGPNSMNKQKDEVPPDFVEVSFHALMRFWVCQWKLASLFTPSTKGAGLAPLPARLTSSPPRLADFRYSTGIFEKYTVLKPQPLILA
ncbi:unnamed protein product [Arabidopsis lyrata]|uniref:Predicted protein n=1 Tax=Arabidopsis lyrata subsp. lyrata TaxID=81972 RepID=D7MC16_ARALL|nr:predicted protein [Arabidopsis lyrata subsp. lyrata]CAH8276320.1 unnamed protein product [Arabidopsis lyrata]